MVRELGSRGRTAAAYPILRSAVLVIGCCGLLGPRAAAADVDFAREVQPILVAKCQKCHGPDKQKGGLRFDTRDGVLAKGDSGEASVVPGRAARSELIRRATATDDRRMPPGDDRLTPAQVATLRKWIDGGAAWPGGGVAVANPGRKELVVTDEDRRHWAFVPLAHVEPPAVRDVAWPRTPVDRFVLAALEAKRLGPTARADPRTLIRRVTFDLTGLPPTPEEIDAFLAAAREDPERAWAPLVDRLLASPAYGERWGRHWLDVARYADSSGQEGDADRPNAWHYRDFVIKALNEDMPFDRFVRWQLAGDEYAPDDPRAVAATGFLVAGPNTLLRADLLEEEQLRNRYNELDDMVATTGTALLGLTVGCARCHDHKFDPVPTRDYYRLLAALHTGDRADVPLGTRAEVEAYNRQRSEWERQLADAEGRLKGWLDGQKKVLLPPLRRSKIDALPIAGADKALLRDKPGSEAAKVLAQKHAKALAVGDAELRKAMDGAARRRWDELVKEVGAVRGREPKSLVAYAFRDAGAKPAASWLFARGDFRNRQEPVELGFLTVLSGKKAAAEYWKAARAAGDRTDTTYQRRALADWITDADAGAGALLARVIVNRVWQHHFGEGLVRTVNDFGTQGERPTHPELLDFLAADLVANGWKLKRLHRAVLLGSAYRQGIAFDPAKARADPDNRLLWRMRPQRLEAEALRDSILAVSGTLNPERYGPAFKPPIPPEAMVARNVKGPEYPKNVPDSPAVRRRSVYLFNKRVIPYPLFQAFDAPDAQQCTGRRANTTVAPQALALLNDPFVRARAADFAARLLREAGDDPAACIDRAYLLAFARPPRDGERAAGVAFVTAQVRQRRDRDPKVTAPELRQLALTDYCQVLFGLNEFIYAD